MMDRLGLDELAKIAAVCERACDAAREQILPRFRKVGVEWKPDGTPVTEADRAAERAIREVLSEAHPDFALLGEEYGEDGEQPASTPRFIVDPIDGTISFARGLPLFATLIALCQDDVSLVGVIDLPALGERVVGWRGGGCRIGDHAIHVSDQAKLEGAIIALGDPITFEWSGMRGVYEAITRKAPLVRGYTDAFGHVQVLCGRVDAMVDCHLSPWDAAATRVLVEEAGGRCVSIPRDGGRCDLVFGSPPLVERLLELLPS